MTDEGWKTIGLMATAFMSGGFGVLTLWINRKTNRVVADVAAVKTEVADVKSVVDGSIATHASTVRALQLLQRELGPQTVNAASGTGSPPPSPSTSHDPGA